MENRYKINYDIKQRCITNAKFKQGDVDSSVLEVNLYDGGKSIDITGEAIEFRFLKPDGTIVFQDSSTGVNITNATSGVVECVLKNNTLAAAGVVKTEIYRSKDGKKLTTPSFCFVVEESIGEGGVLSSNYISAIENKILEWQSTFNSNESARQSTFNSNEANREQRFEVIKKDYDSYKKVMIAESNVAALQSQINQNASQLAENAMKTLTTSSSVNSLTDAVDGVVIVDSIKGRTFKNELTYNKDTWAEWAKSGGVVGDSTGLEFTSSVATVLSNIALRIKPSTKYGFLLNVVSNSISSYLNFFSGGGSAYPFDGVKFWSTNSQIGNIKKIATSSSNFTINSILLALSNDPIGTKIKLKDIRIYELPTGSEIEADFNTMSADELALKYPFYSGIASTGEVEGNVELLTTGKNLFNFKQDYIEKSSNVDVSLLSNGIKVKNSSTNKNQYVAYMLKKLKPNATYSLSLIRNIITGGVTNSARCFVYRDDILLNTVGNNNNAISFNTSASGKIKLVFSSNWEDAVAGEVDYTNIQFVEGTTTLTYEPYKEDKINLALKEPLRGLITAVDEILASQSKLVRRIGKVILNGSENWGTSGLTPQINTLIFQVNYYTNNTINLKSSSILRSDKFPNSDIGNDIECVSNNAMGTDNKGIYIRILKSKLTPYGFIEGTTSTYVTAFKAWLQANPTTIYYELATPVEEELSIPSLKCFKGGTLQLNNAITPNITIKYPSNLSSRVQTTEIELDRAFDSLGGAWKTILALADKDLKLKSISLLTTETVTDLKNKVNEILSIWR